MSLKYEPASEPGEYSQRKAVPEAVVASARPQSGLTLHPAPCALHPAPYTLNPEPRKPSTLNPKPGRLAPNLQPHIFNPNTG